MCIHSQPVDVLSRLFCSRGHRAEAAQHVTKETMSLCRHSQELEAYKLEVINTGTRPSHHIYESIKADLSLAIKCQSMLGWWCGQALQCGECTQLVLVHRQQQGPSLTYVRYAGQLVGLFGNNTGTHACQRQLAQLAAHKRRMLVPQACPLSPFTRAQAQQAIRLHGSPCSVAAALLQQCCTVSHPVVSAPTCTAWRMGCARLLMPARPSSQGQSS